MRLEPFSLTGRHVRLEPLSPDHVDDLAAAGSADRSTFGFTPVPDDREAAAAYVQWLLDDAARDTVVPFAQRRLRDDTVVGCTRFLNVTWWPDRRWPVEVEIGGTWLATDAQRTLLNTEAKLLLLSHAFDSLGVFRVAICTAAGNTQSRTAIERLGATFEGILRNHRPSAGALGTPGLPRDTAAYSIIDTEWPTVRTRLQERLRG